MSVRTHFGRKTSHLHRVITESNNDGFAFLIIPPESSLSPLCDGRLKNKKILMFGNLMIMLSQAKFGSDAVFYAWPRLAHSPAGQIPVNAAFSSRHNQVK